MPRFVCKSSVTSDREYLPGEEIELTEEQAAAMPWAVDPVPEPKKSEEKPAKKVK